DKRGARALAGAILGLLFLGAGILAVLGIAFAPAITTVLAKGFDEPRRQLTISLVRVLFPMTGLMVISAWCLGILNTHRRFFLPYAAPALWNVAGIAAMVVAAGWLSGRGFPPEQQLYRLSLALAWGTVLGSVLQIAIQLPSCWKLLGGIPLRVSFVPEGVRDVIVAWAPLVVGAGVAQLSGLVDTFLGSYTGEGGVANLGYAQLVQQLPVSLFGVAITAVSLPELSRDAVGATPHDQLRARIASISLMISALLSWLFMRRFGPAGIALGSSIGQSFNTVLHLYDLDKRIGTILQRTDWRTLGLVVGAGLIAALLGMGAAHLVAAWRPTLQGITVLGIFGVAYGALTTAFRHPDAIRAWQSLTG